MKLHSYLQRLATFTLTKISLVLGRWLTLMLAFRWLPAEQFSWVAATLSVVEILRALADFGVENLVFSRLSAPGRVLSPVLKTLIPLRVVVACAIGAVSVLVVGFTQVQGAWLMMLLMPVFAFQNTSMAFLQKHRHYGQVLATALLAMCAGLLAAWIAWQNEASGTQLFACLVMPEILTAMAGIVLSRPSWGQLTMGWGSLGVRRVRRLIPFLMPSGLVGLLVMAYSRLDVLLVMPLLGVLAQGQYSAGFRLVEPVFMALSLISISFLAELGALNSRGAGSVARATMSKLNGMLITLFVVSAFVLGLMAEWAARAVLEFPERAAVVAGIIAATVPVKLLNTGLTAILQRKGRFDRVMAAAVVNLVVTWVTAAGLGLSMGVEGVAVGALLGETVNFLFQRREVNALV